MSRRKLSEGEEISSGFSNQTNLLLSGPDRAFHKLTFAKTLRNLLKATT
jgi:hypothetical protein